MTKSAESEGQLCSKVSFLRWRASYLPILVLIVLVFFRVFNARGYVTVRHLILEGRNICHLGERDVKLLVILVVGHAEKFVAHIKQTPGRIAQPTDGVGGQVGLLTYKKCARSIKLVAIQFAPILLGSSCVITVGSCAGGCEAQAVREKRNRRASNATCVLNIVVNISFSFRKVNEKEY